MTSMVLESARRARRSGLYIRPDEVSDPWVLVRVEGPDAASFLHSQTTNDVNGLESGQGHMGARTTRTGHLISLFSCHRMPKTQVETFVLAVQRSQREALWSALDSMHFTDDLTLSCPEEKAAVLQGPSAAALLSGLGGEWSAVQWHEMTECSVRRVGESTVIRRSLTGDPGFLVWSTEEGVWDRLGALISAESGVVGDEGNQVLDALRIEAGWPRMGPDTQQKRLLPETGLEGQTVSYTKGCYLGQEVIARVRTYGSLPKALRILVFEVQRKGLEHTLEQIPEAGEPVVLADGTKVGHYGSRALSPTTEKPIAFAYLNKDSRSPGKALTVWGLRGPMQVKVVVAPLYTSADRRSRVAHLYDRSIRVFAEGKEDLALQLLEEVLRLDPTFADGYEVLGVIYGRQGKFHEAIDFFRRLEEVAPLEPMVNTNLSLYYMKLGDKETAEDQSALAAQKSMRRGRQGVEVQELIEAQVEARRNDALRKKGMFEQVLDFDPEDPIALFGMGTALSVLGQWPEAVESLRRASEVDRRNSAVYMALGKALEALEKLEEALVVYQAGIDVASRRGDLMPLKEMEHRLLLLKATTGSSE